MRIMEGGHIMDWLNDFVGWAWARHHNILSWYIRPLFFIPFCYFAYKRSWRGIILTLVGLATSMFWFPAPARPDPEVVAMLEAERAYLTGPWEWWKLLIGLLVPGTLTLLGLVFWKRSLWYGVALVNGMALFKIGWSFVFAPAEGALALLVPATIGLVVCNVVFLLAVRWLRGRADLQPIG